MMWVLLAACLIPFVFLIVLRLCAGQTVFWGGMFIFDLLGHFGTGAIRLFVGRVNAVFGFAMIGLLFCGMWGYQSAKTAINCHMGDQAACTAGAEYAPDNVPAPALAAWQAMDMNTRLHTTRFDDFHLPRWSISKTIWYDGELVRVHRSCLGWDYPTNDIVGDRMCDGARIETGKHTGFYLPQQTRSSPYNWTEQAKRTPGYIPGAGPDAETRALLQKLGML